MAGENETKREVGPLEKAFGHMAYSDTTRTLARAVDEHDRELRVCKAEWTALYQRVARLEEHTQRGGETDVEAGRAPGGLGSF